MNPVAALNAYASAARLLGGPGQSQAAPAATADAGGFAGLVKAAIDSTEATGKAAEAKAAAMAAGRADIVDVVTAVAETELAIESMVTVRDRVIAAYQEIMNMPI